MTSVSEVGLTFCLSASVVFSFTLIDAKEGKVDES
jgi:hypothetical protein